MIYNMDKNYDDRNNAVCITKSGAFLYQTGCSLINDIKRFRIIQYNYYELKYKDSNSFYTYEVFDEMVIINGKERISFLYA